MKTKAKAGALFVLSYNQPTLERGQIVPGKTWYVSHRPGDGGVDWGYTLEPAKAVPLSVFWLNRFRKLHGSRVNAREVT
jgi:hypothetical protein